MPKYENAMRMTIVIVSTKWLALCYDVFSVLGMLFHRGLKCCFNMTQEYLENTCDGYVWLACIYW